MQNMRATKPKAQSILSLSPFTPRQKEQRRSESEGVGVEG